jgi:hypothetical protein
MARSETACFGESFIGVKDEKKSLAINDSIIN